MTQLTLISFAFLILSWGLTSCVPRGEILEALSESEAVEILESELQELAGGLTTNLEDMAQELVDAIVSGELCDTLYTDTLDVSHQVPKIQSSYVSAYSYELGCNSFNLPENATFSSNTDYSYSTQRMDSENDAVLAGDASGLQLLSDTILMNGTYSKNGTQELNFSQRKDVTSTLVSDLSNIKVDKQNYDIASGSGTFTFAGTTSEGNFSYSGSILFTGNKTATLTIDETDYDIDWN